MLAEDSPMQPIRILVTGGTFDKEYNELSGELFFQSTHTGDMLRLGRCLLKVEIETLMMIDSLQMDDAGRRHILERCASVPEKRIVITHGTDTMAETAATLGAGLKVRYRRILLLVTCDHHAQRSVECRQLSCE